MRDVSVLPSLFGAQLKRLRAEAKLSQEVLAADCGLDRSYISLLENGKHQPSLASLLLIADALNVDAAAVLAEIDKQIPHTAD